VQTSRVCFVQLKHCHWADRARGQLPPRTAWTWVYFEQLKDFRLKFKAK
jgi:hypothetical protein